jgi:hypothetical protein
MGLTDMGCAGEKWNKLAHDGVQWRIFVSTVMHFWVPEKLGIS